jgi:predicted peptidase
MIEEALALETKEMKRLALKYLLFSPIDNQDRSTDLFPLILFLHGSGERGNHLEDVKKIGLPKKLQSWPDCPFIVVVPQCPADSVWAYQLDALKALLDSVIASYQFDVSRIYLTGMSLGGTGTWYLAGAFPTYFAAISPICGHNTGRSQCALFSHIPVWIFHGAKDLLIPVAESQHMEAALKSLDADVRLTVYPDADHDAWTLAYDEPELYLWFLRHYRT